VDRLVFLLWYRQATQSRVFKKQSLYGLVQIGRWLAGTHPQVTSPGQWDYALAADFIAAVDQLKVGDWRSPNAISRNSIAPLESP